MGKADIDQPLLTDLDFNLPAIGALALTPQRRFPPPWSAEETDACFTVMDKNERYSHRYLTINGFRRSMMRLAPTG